MTYLARRSLYSHHSISLYKHYICSLTDLICELHTPPSILFESFAGLGEVNVAVRYHRLYLGGINARLDAGGIRVGAGIYSS